MSKKLKKTNTAIIALAVLHISGCVGPLVPVKDFSSIPSEQENVIKSIPIYNESQLHNTKYNIINVVEGISCKNKIWDPAATKAAAIDQAKYWAYELNADALMNIQCDNPRGTTRTYNCWESVTCTAQAIELPEAQ